MAYITLAELKEDLNVATEGDEYILEQKIDAAQSTIEFLTGRVFEAVTATRYYDQDAVDGLILWLDADLVALTSVANGDSAGTAISTADITLLPRNEGPPYDRLRLKASSVSAWTVSTDYWISIVGTWGWSATPPAQIAQACRRLAAHMYKLRDSDVFDVIAFPGEGVMQVKKAIPIDVANVISHYTKRI